MFECEFGDGESVRDGARAVNGFGSVIAACGFEDVGAGGVGDDVGVVVGEISVLVSAAAALSVFAQECGNGVHGFFGGGGAFECEAQKVHADEARFLFVGGLGEHGFVADGHAFFIGTDFCAPHPEWVGGKRGESLRHVGDVDVGAVEAGVGRVTAGGGPDEVLALIRIAVGVLPK